MVVQNLSSPFFEKLLVGSYVRIVAGVQQYIMARVEKITKASSSYTLQSGGKQNDRCQTKYIILVQHGRTTRNVKLDVISNGELTLDEVLAYKSVCEKFKVELPLK